MPRNTNPKECTECRVCLEPETNVEINKYQAKRRAKDGLPYPKFEAASDYLNELSRRDRLAKK